MTYQWAVQCLGWLISKKNVNLLNRKWRSDYVTSNYASSVVTSHSCQEPPDWLPSHPQITLSLEISAGDFRRGYLWNSTSAGTRGATLAHSSQLPYLYQLTLQLSNCKPRKGLADKGEWSHLFVCAENCWQRTVYQCRTHTYAAYKT